MIITPRVFAHLGAFPRAGLWTLCIPDLDPDGDEAQFRAVIVDKHDATRWVWRVKSWRVEAQLELITGEEGVPPEFFGLDEVFEHGVHSAVMEERDLIKGLPGISGVFSGLPSNWSAAFSICAHPLLPPILKDGSGLYYLDINFSVVEVDLPKVWRLAPDPEGGPHIEATMDGIGTYFIGFGAAEVYGILNITPHEYWSYDGKYDTSTGAEL